MNIEKEKNKSVYFILIMQIFSTFAYGVLYCSLVLFATKALNLSDMQATSIVVSFIAFIYAMRLVGGFIAGRFFSNRFAFLTGIILQSISSVFLIYQKLYIGLALFLPGAGLVVICLNSFITQLFSEHEIKKRETAFLWNYSAMNFGYIFAYVISGIFESLQNYKLLFFISAISNIFPMIMILINWERFRDKKNHFISVLKSEKTSIFLGYTIIAALVISLFWLVRLSFISNALIIILSLVMGGIIIYHALRQKTKIAREKFWAFFILTLMSVVFWTLYILMPNALTLFIEHNVDRTFFNFSIPPQWVLSINTFLIIIGGPLLVTLFNYLRRKGFLISLPIQFTTALLLITLAFVILTLGIKFVNKEGFVSIIWIVISYVLITFGELFISPISYAMVGQLIPHKEQNIMMGITMLVSATAAVISDFFTKMAIKNVSTDPIVTNPYFEKMFFILSIGSLITTIILLILVPFLHKLIKAPKEESYHT